MTIYLDIVLIENILLNYIIILSTAIISKEKVNFIRIVTSSIVGGIFCILNYFFQIPMYLETILKIMISIIMMKIAFNKNKRFIKTLMFFYLVSFTFGGIAFMLLFIISPQNVKLNGNTLIGIYPLKVTILAGAFGFMIISIIAQIIKNKYEKKTMICDLEIFYKGNCKKIKSMLDTGNLLKEPLTKADVIIVEKESLYGIINIEILENINEIIKGSWLEDSNVHSYKLKVIPFSSLGNENGILIGFKPDYIKVYDEDEYIRYDVIIGIYNGKLTKNGMYSGLIGLGILN